MSHASLGHPIGMGSSSEVFGLDAATVLKLYRSHVDPSLIAREALVAAHATRLGLSTAAPLGRQMADGRHGLILERVHGPVMMRAVRARPIGALLALRRLARLQAAIHAHPAPEGLRRQREGLAFDIAQADAPPAIQRRAQAALERLPDGDRLCHGDLHPSNVMLDRDGAMRVIDWSRAAAGNPHADVIRSELLIRFAAQGRGGLADRALDLVRDLLGRWYVRCYARAAGVPVKAQPRTVRSPSVRVPMKSRGAPDISSSHAPWIAVTITMPRSSRAVQLRRSAAMVRSTIVSRRSGRSTPVSRTASAVTFAE